MWCDRRVQRSAKSFGFQTNFFYSVWLCLYGLVGILGERAGMSTIDDKTVQSQTFGFLILFKLKKEFSLTPSLGLGRQLKLQ